MVGDQANKGDKSKISLVSAKKDVQKASSQDNRSYIGPFRPDPDEKSAQIYRPPWQPVPCPYLKDIGGICQKLSSFCSNTQKVMDVLDARKPPIMMPGLDCKEKDGRCPKDVPLADCPIRAMYDCAPQFKNCQKEGCEEFLRMAVCPFADKSKFARCDYSYRIWPSSAPNHSPTKNLKNSFCGQEVKTVKKNGVEIKVVLPESVAKCCNSVFLPDESKIKLQVKPILQRNKSPLIGISNYGFGMRFMEGGGKREHKGVDIHSVGLIYAAADGVITQSQIIGGGGWFIQIFHTKEDTGSQMDYYTGYMHMTYPPELKMSFDKDQPLGVHPVSRSVIRSALTGRVVYRRKSCLTDVWGADKLYDIVLASGNLPDVTGGDGLTPLSLRFDTPVEVSPVGTKDYFADNQLTEEYSGMKNGSPVSGKLYFVRLWIPYTMGTDSTTVRAGQVIGLESNTGLNQKPRSNEHLHFEITQDKGRTVFVNPYKVLMASLPEPSTGPG